MNTEAKGADEVTADALELWAWFLAHISDIESAIESTQAGLPAPLAELDARVAGLAPGLSWEIGPFDDGWFFALSPGGSAERLSLTTRLVALAAVPKGWVFLASKPGKAWDRSVVFEGKAVDVSGWRYKIHRGADGAFGMRWGATPAAYLSSLELERLGRLVLESELGEEPVIRHIADVEVTQLSDWSDPEDGGALYSLRAHLTQLARDPR